VNDQTFDAKTGQGQLILDVHNVVIKPFLRPGKRVSRQELSLIIRKEFGVQLP
jgi:hypothetical protein